MVVLILTRFMPFLNNYKKWLRDCEQEIVIFTKKKYEIKYQEEGYKNVYGFDDYDNDATIEFAALELHSKKKYDYIIALDERDIIRAAVLRQKFHLPGQKYDSSIAYRNKILMKKLLCENGVEVAPYREIKTIFDILEFINIHGFPVLIKPIAGMGAMHTKKIDDYEMLKLYFSKETMTDKMVEKYLDFNMGTCDGVVVNGKVVFTSACQYYKSRLKYDEYLCLSILEPNDKIYHLLTDLGRKIVSILPTMKNGTFHAEIFFNGNRLYLCEIASRTAGGRIDECIKQSYGIDFNEIASRAELELEIDITNCNFIGISGSMLIPKRKGLLEKTLEKFPFDWVTEYALRYQKGDMLGDPIANGDILASVVIIAPSKKILLERFKIIKDYFELHTKIM